jgi:hypothetical protein
MSPLSGYGTALPNEILLNPALIQIGSTVIGVTKGGVSWDPQITFGDVAFDGERSRIKGLTRKTKHGGKLTGNLLQIGTAAQTLRLEAGAASATSTVTGITSVVTPLGAGVLLTSGAYVTDLRAIWETGQGSGHYYAIHMPVALCVKYGIKGGDNGEADVSFEFDAVLDMAATGSTITDAPYNIEIRTALP